MVAGRGIGEGRRDVSPGQSAAAGREDRAMQDPVSECRQVFGGDVCLASWHVKAGGWRGTLAAFFSILEKKTENSSEALAAGLTDTKQPRNKAQRRDFKATQAPLSVCSRTLLLPPGKGTATLLKEVTSIIPHVQLLKAR